MKTALGGGSQHREKAVNDSGGGGINNAALPLSLQPTVPRSLSPSFLPPTLSPPLYVPPPVVACNPCCSSSPLRARCPACPVGGALTNQPLLSLSLSFPAARAALRETFVRPLPASTFSHLWPPAPRPLGSFSASPQPWVEATSGRRKR